jgi:Fic family protein
MPKKPPSWRELLKPESSMDSILAAFVSMGDELSPKGRYLHWDKLRFLKPPGTLSHEQWWAALKLKRMGLRKQVALHDTTNEPFTYCLTDSIQELLHQIDQGGGGFIELPEQITSPETRDRYVISSLMEEAIRSSQIEGAVATRTIAKEMLRSGRDPRDKNEQMILNNYAAMQHIRKLKNDDLTPETLLYLHRILMDGTVRPDEEDQIGRFQRPNEPVFVMDEYDEVFHAPPPADTLEQRVAQMCDFANGKIPDHFVHPVLRAIILHFWLAYDHPFTDGNGRCARAVFYWLMLKSKYWLTEYISISEVIYRAPVKYYRAFLYTETDDNDLTYFILYHLQIVKQAVQELHAYINRKTDQVRQLEKQLRLTDNLNHRQRALLSHALRHPDARYTFESHQRSHGVVYETARTDLLTLRDISLLSAQKIGRTWHFSPVSDLERRLQGDRG